MVSLLMSIWQAASGTKVPDSETLRYKVTYKWGLIHKHAGTGTLSVERIGDNRLKAVMTGRTDSWADRFFEVRDTLISIFSADTAVPVSYERIAHEGGSYARDLVSFSRQGNKSKAHCVRHRRGKKDRNITTTEIDLEAEGDAVDLLSSFYYIRRFDFETMNPGTQRTVNIFSGKRKELLKFVYFGPETVKFDGRKYDAYKVTFQFTSEGRKKTSEPIEAWLSTAPGHVPLKLIGELKIGKIQIFLE